MFTITPKKGESYTVNSCHILSLKMTGGASFGGYRKGDVVNIPVDEYMSKPKTFKHCAKGYRVGVDFPCTSDLEINPYFFGYWIGDGISRSQAVVVGDSDHEVVSELRSQAASAGMALAISRRMGHSIVSLSCGKGVKNPIKDSLKSLGVLGKKSIPHKYKTCSREGRLELLAGLIDSDGSLGHSGYDFVSVSKEIASDVAYVARSLGFAAYVAKSVKKCFNNGAIGLYYRVSISGDVSEIPCRIARKKSEKRKQKKDCLVTGLSVSPSGEGEYFGFELDGDGLFLLGDFTVTHNTTQAYELFRYCQHYGMSGAFYVNRKLLIGQTADRFRAGGLDVGIRAADYEDQFNNSAQFQICSADTERSRVIKSGIWGFSDAQLVVIDEAHIQKTETMERIMAHYRHRGARIVGLTATPIGLSSWFDELVVSGRIREYHECKSLVPAYVYGISEPDMRKVKRNLTGEFVLDGKKTKIYVQSIVADVLSSWKRLNPDARPTMLFAPGKDESVWFTEQFEKIGVPWCHVDATDAVLKGKRYRLNRKLWLEIQDMYRSGEIRGLSSRFKLREGVDLPCTYHAILATPIGSLASYIQTVGRALRYSPETPEKVIIQDHGGNYHRLGSPNQDRPWKDFWMLPEHAASTYLTESIRDGKEKEPLRCPKCGLERMSGITCPGCSFTHEKGRRKVIMEDGTIKEIEGPMVRPKRVRMTSDTQEKWTKLYFAYRRKGLDKSFKQMLGFFVYEHGYHPPLNLDYMPKNDFDWYAKVKNIGPELLIDSKREYSSRELFKT